MAKVHQPPRSLENERLVAAWNAGIEVAGLVVRFHLSAETIGRRLRAFEAAGMKIAERKQGRPRDASAKSRELTE